MMAKKGEWQWNTLLAIVAAAMLGLILIWYLNQASTVSNEASDKEQCIASVQAQALKGRISPGSTVDLRCATQYDTITTSDAQKQKAIIANQMADCWERLGEGKIRLFADETGSYCVICSRLEFTKPQKLERFGEYLFQNKVPLKGTTYYSYLFGSATASDAQKQYSSFAAQDNLDVSKPMAVVFIAEKKVENTWTGYLVSAGAAVAVGGAILFTGGTAIPFLVVGGTAAGFTGATSHYIIGPYFKDRTFNAGIMLWPYDEVPSLKCGVLEGKAGELQFVS